jgi:hypothetical protein
MHCPATTRHTIATMTEPPKRHWYQFSLRTLLIGVTLLAVACAYVGWQARTVSERRAMRERIEKTDKGTIWERSDDVPWLRRILGDEAIPRIILPFETDVEERRKIRAVFPEATLAWMWLRGISYAVSVPFLDGSN